MRNYQYETSPRKYELEYDDRPKKKKTKKAKQTQKNKRISKKQLDKKKEKREKAKYSVLFVFNVIIFMLIAFAIMFRHALINQSFVEIQSLQTQISELQKENDQLEIGLQNSLNLSSIEQTARDTLGMQKLTNKQTIYLSLPKKDYVEPSTEEIILEEHTSLIRTIINFFENIFKD